MNELVKVLSKKGSRKIVLGQHLGSFSDDAGNELGTISVSLNYTTPMVEIDGNIFTLDFNKFLNYILENKDALLAQDLEDLE